MTTRINVWLVREAAGCPGYACIGTAKPLGQRDGKPFYGFGVTRDAVTLLNDQATRRLA